MFGFKYENTTVHKAKNKVTGEVTLISLAASKNQKVQEAFEIDPESHPAVKITYKNETVYLPVLNVPF